MAFTRPLLRDGNNSPTFQEQKQGKSRGSRGNGDMKTPFFKEKKCPNFLFHRIHGDDRHQRCFQELVDDQ